MRSVSFGPSSLEFQIGHFSKSVTLWAPLRSFVLGDLNWKFFNVGYPVDITCCIAKGEVTCCIAKGLGEGYWLFCQRGVGGGGDRKECWCRLHGYPVCAGWATSGHPASHGTRETADQGRQCDSRHGHQPGLPPHQTGQRPGQRCRRRAGHGGAGAEDSGAGGGVQGHLQGHLVRLRWKPLHHRVQVICHNGQVLWQCVLTGGFDED